MAVVALAGQLVFIKLDLAVITALVFMKQVKDHSGQVVGLTGVPVGGIINDNLGDALHVSGLLVDHHLGVILRIQRPGV